MSEDLEQEVEVRQWQNDFDELTGRATPPDRLDPIMRRIASGRATPDRPRTMRSNSHLLAAAIILLGLFATIGVAMMQNDVDKQARADANSGDGNFAILVTPVPEPESMRIPQPTKTEKPEHPKGTDPADLAAIRSSEAMLAAEQRLQQLLAEGKVTGFDRLLKFDEVTGWTYDDGLRGMPENIKQLSGEKVLMTGFMLPIDEVENIGEFLLVKSLWSCCYGQPPDVNGLVRCVMPKDQATDYMFDPLKVVGTFKVEATRMDGYCVDIFQLAVDQIEKIE